MKRDLEYEDDDDSSSSSSPRTTRVHGADAGAGGPAAMKKKFGTDVNVHMTFDGRDISDDEANSWDEDVSESDEDAIEYYDDEVDAPEVTP